MCSDTDVRFWEPVSKGRSDQEFLRILAYWLVSSLWAGEPVLLRQAQRENRLSLSESSLWQASVLENERSSNVISVFAPPSAPCLYVQLPLTAFSKACAEQGILVENPFLETNSQPDRSRKGTCNYFQGPVIKSMPCIMRQTHFPEARHLRLAALPLPALRDVELVSVQR